MEILTIVLTVAGYTAGVRLHVLSKMVASIKKKDEAVGTDKEIERERRSANLKKQALILSLAAYLSLLTILSGLFGWESITKLLLLGNVIALMAAHGIADYGLCKLYCGAFICKHNKSKPT